ncbi:MAG TPA: hypothetical protein VG797_10540 [Phycisphaerales bacterium]|nr:hypothetical protein [Phycisphaerales bacterium]
MKRHLHTTTLLFLAAGVLTGCKAKPKNFDNENDALRRRVTELETQLAATTAERNELQAKLAEAARTSAAAGGLSEEAREALPRCAGVRLGRLSGPVADDGTPGLDAIDFYVQPFDGRQRFVPVAGTLTASAAFIPRTSGTAVPPPPPRELGRVTLSPNQLREAYRASPLGTHYTVRLPLDPPNMPLEGTVVLRVELLDALTGQTWRAEQLVP